MTPRPPPPDEARDALAAQTPPNKHGQLCPVWTRRRKGATVRDCDCWVLTNAATALSRLAASGWVVSRVTDGDAGDDLGAAWAAAEAALPEGADLMVGHTTECRFCAGWWATSSKRPTEPPYYPDIVSSETGRPRGEHHDATPAAALRALAAHLTEPDRETTP